MNSTLHILGITGPIYLAIAMGYVFTRRGMFAKADMQVFGKFTLNLALPALLFNALSQRRIGEILNAQYLLAYALGSLMVALLGLYWARKVKGYSLSYSSMMAMGMSCPNSGFVGYPIMLLTIGPVAGVALALNMVVENLLMIPLLLAVADASGDTRGRWRRVLGQTFSTLVKNPMIWGIVGGLIFAWFDLELAPPLARTVNLFAQTSAVLALFVIGGSLVGLQLKGLAGTVSLITFGKLFLHPLAMWGVLMLLVPVADPALRTAALLSGALPMLGIFTLLSQRHGHAAISAAALLLTTVVSFFSLSALLWVLQHSSF
jgi:predicted permease